MDNLTAQLKKLVHAGGRRWDFEESHVVVHLEASDRHHAIHLEEQGDDYVFTGVVLGAAEVTLRKKRWYELAKLAWQRNAEQEVVSFGFDRRDRLIGQIRHPVEHLDLQELDFYIHVLARECDRFEYLLSGRDEY